MTIQVQHRPFMGNTDEPHIASSDIKVEDDARMKKIMKKKIIQVIFKIQVALSKKLKH